MSLNDNGFDVELVRCEYCFDEYDCSPDDPMDLCECPNCVEQANGSRVDLIMI